MHFSRQNALLLPISEQLEIIRLYTKKYWRRDLTAEQSDMLTSFRLSHVEQQEQRIDRLTLLHVSFGPPLKTVYMWLRVLKGELQEFWYPDMEVYRGRMSYHPSARHYAAGIHVVHDLNLVDHWEPDFGISIKEARSRTVASGRLLAHTEILAAYGLHIALARTMNGDTQPFANLGGLAVCRVYSPWDWNFAPWFGADFNYPGLGLGDGHTEVELRQWSTPTLSQTRVW